MAANVATPHDPAADVSSVPVAEKAGQDRSKGRLRWIPAACFGTVVIFAACTLQALTITARAITHQASATSIKPERILLDASEGRERALLSIDASIVPPAAAEHRVALQEGSCSLRTGDGVSFLHLHLASASYEGASKARFDIELEHGSVQEMAAALRRARGGALLDCDFGVDVDLLGVGWAFRAWRSVRVPLGGAVGDAASGARVRFVREDGKVLLPTWHNFTMAADANYRLEVSVPSSAAQQFLPMVEGAPVEVKAGVTFAEEAVGAMEARVGVDAALQHWTEDGDAGSRTVFGLPVRVAGSADAAALGAVLSAAAAGERAELGPQGGRHFHVRPCMGRQEPEHSVSLAARAPRCALARALGARHSVSLRADGLPGAPSLVESLAKGRQLLARKLSGATMEGYELRMHERLFIDDSFAARVDLEIKGGDLAQPALQVNAGFLLKEGQERSNDSGSYQVSSSGSSAKSSSSSWEYSATGVAFTARMMLDMNVGTISGEFSETLVLDKTESKEHFGQDRWSGDRMFSGPSWEHEVLDIRSRGSASYDGPTKLARAGVNVRVSEVKRLLVGLEGVSYNWTQRSNNPSQAGFDPFALAGRTRRLLDAAAESDAIQRAVGTARQLAARFEEAESKSFNVSVDASIDLDGTGNGNVFDADFSLQVADMISAKFGWTVTETSPSNYKHDALVDLQGREVLGFRLGQQIAPTLAGGSELRIDSVSPDDKVKLDMAVAATASIVTDFSTPAKLRVSGSASVLPTCSVHSGQESKLQSLGGLGINVSASDPQCRQCSQSGDQSSWYTAWSPSATLHSRCGSQEKGWTGSYWKAATSCCAYDMGFGDGNISMGSELRDQFSFELNRGNDLLDVFGWLQNDMEMPKIMEGLPQNVTATYSTAGGTVTRSWLFKADAGKEARLDLTEVSNSLGGKTWRLTATEGGQTMLTASLETEDQNGAVGFTFREVPEFSVNESAEVKLRLSKDATTQTNCFLSGHVKTGAALEQRCAVDAVATSTGERLDASVTVHEAKKMGSAELVVNDPAGLSGDLNLVVKGETGQQVGRVFFGVVEVTDRITCSAFVEDDTSRMGSVEAKAERLNAGDLLSAQLKVRDESNTVKLGLAGSLAKASSSAVLDAVVSMDGNTGGTARGALPKQGSFYAGDVLLTVDNHTQVLWVNASEGFVPSAPKDGLSGFERMHLAVGTSLEKAARVNASFYLEAPPFGEGLSGCGVAADVDELVAGGGRRDLVDASVDLEFPFTSTGVSSSGQMVKLVAEVVQEVSAEVAMVDVMRFDLQTYKAEMAKAAHIDASLIEIDRVEYKVEVEYSFPEAVSEAEARGAVAMANGVSESQVQVKVTNARRRLIDEPAAENRRLQAVDVQATIQTASAESVSAIKTTAQNTSTLTQALQTTANKVVAPAVKVAPASKVSVVTKMHTTVAPTLAAADLATLGTAVGGAVLVTDMHAATVFVAAPVTTPAPGLPGLGNEGVADLAMPAAQLSTAACLFTALVVAARVG